MKHILSVLIPALLLFSCDPCTDCDPFNYEPTVELQFVRVEIEDEVKKNTIITNPLIYWDNVSGFLEFKEGINKFPVPLSYTDMQSEYTMVMEGIMFSLVLDYDLEKQFDANRRVIIRALNIDSVSHTFDSLVFKCGSFGCVDKQTSITCYF